MPPLLRRGQTKAAAAALQRLAQDGAPPWEVLLWVGRLHERQGRWEEAEQAYRKALTAAPPEGSGLELELARFLEKRGRLEEAEACLAQRVKGGGASQDARLALVRLREKMEAEWPRAFSALLPYRPTARAACDASGPPLSVVFTASSNCASSIPTPT